ncbi:MAG TPA: DOMON-like domain-containing protein [Steroidobacteraceae bacterium]|jgi:hypothetical protein|nr:DOMON-like domain-containing protein [Steroidobacteraceae bacterium]
MEPLPLVCHPAAPCSYVSAVTARVDRLSADLLVVYYQIEGDIDQLQLPPQRRSAHTDGLWQHTCFEAFVRESGGRSYVELNFSPSSEWAIYRFDDYRRGMTPIEPPHAPKIICRRRENRLEADVDVHLTGIVPQAELQLALSAVLEDQQGKISYWALAHPPGNADFHHDAGFTLRLTPTGDEE